eukprot:602366_1
MHWIISIIFISILMPRSGTGYSSTRTNHVNATGKNVFGTKQNRAPIAQKNYVLQRQRHQQRQRVQPLIDEKESEIEILRCRVAELERDRNKWKERAIYFESNTEDDANKLSDTEDDSDVDPSICLGRRVRSALWRMYSECINYGE